MENPFNKDSDTQIIDIKDSIKSSCLDYSMSMVIERALPNARDGLKPVHRHILYVMSNLGVRNRSAYKRSARIVGDVIGKYHPHGDTAVYDALVRMVQSFSMRYPSVDGQGNFDSIGGDDAAAMCYTEARMTILTEELLRDTDEDTVDFVPNCDDSMQEPDVLPGRVPGLLLNGSSRIAVGMATNIPPHSPNELVDGLLYLLDNKEAGLEELIQFIKGPDFPTAGIIYGKKGTIDAYRTGRGRIKIRAKTHIEKRANKDIIVIDGLPYQTSEAGLIEQIAEPVKERQIRGIAEVRNESDRKRICVVIEPKRDAMSEIVLNNLFKPITMESTFGVIMLAIHNKEPKIFSLIELLNLFLTHRKTVIIRRTIYELQKARARAHILEGLKIALDNIDEVIALIKNSTDNNATRESLVAEFGLNELQTNAILDVKLGRLTGLEREKIENELAELLKEIARLDEILKSEALSEDLVREELKGIKVKFDVPRITQIEDDYDDIDVEDLIPNENMVVTITYRGYIKRVSSKQYEKQKRGGKGRLAVTTYDDDFIKSFSTTNTHDILMFATDKGQFYWLKVYKTPEGSRTAKGKAVVNLINLQAEEEIMATIPTSDFAESKSLCFFTKNGIVKRTNLSEYQNIRSVGVRAINLDENDKLVTAIIVERDLIKLGQVSQDENLSEEASEENLENVGGKMLFAVTKRGMCIKFPLAKVREIGRVSRGVTAIKFKEKNDELVGAVIIENDEQEVLSVSTKDIGKRINAGEYRLQSRGGKSVICMKLTDKTKEFISVVIVDESMDLMVLTSSSKMIRVDIHSIRKAGHNTGGAIVVNVENNEVVSIAKYPKESEEEDIKEDVNLSLE